MESYLLKNPIDDHSKHDDIMPPPIPWVVYIQSMSTHSSPPLKMLHKKKNISGTESSDCVYCNESRLCLLVWVEIQLQFTNLHALQCCSAAGWSDNRGVKMEHLANFIRPRSPLEQWILPRGWGSHSTSSSSSWDIDESILTTNHSPSATSLVSGQFQRTYSGSVIALKIGTLRGSWMGRVSAPSLHWRPCLDHRISKF